MPALSVSLNAAEVSILETGFVFQSVAEQAIEADVGGPDQTEGKEGRLMREINNEPKQEGSGVGMAGVVKRGPDFLPKEVADHQQVRRQKQRGKQAPRGSYFVVYDAGCNEYRESLGVE